MSNLLFRKVDYTVGKLLEDIAMGEIGLPDIQRPFVWNTTQVRDLFDSMYRGYPIGTLLFWENGFSEEHRHRTIGIEEKQKFPRLLIVDGQQRLTALYAVIRGVPIIDHKFQKRRLRLAFNPLKQVFEVTNAAIERDFQWIPDISILWERETRLRTFTNRYLERFEEHHSLTEEEEEQIASAVDRLVGLLNYQMTALEISASVSEEEVSQIFERINSQGRILNRADFILTLMSVFWEQGRQEIEDFARRAKRPSPDNQPSPYNPYFQPDPDQLLRVNVALAFRRAKLDHVYALLRGKDLETGEFSVECRNRQFALLCKAQNYALYLQNWHDFLQVIKRAGYLHPTLISSQVALLYTYAFWLIGKRDFALDQHTLRRLLTRWFFMSSLTGRYSSSPETKMDQDLALLRGRTKGQQFIEAFEQEMNVTLTPDYWNITLPNILASASERNTAQLAYYAALCILDAPVLYSSMKVRDFLGSPVRTVRSSLERHHLFPREYLRHLGVKERRDINQPANYALIEWHDNIAVRNQPPHEYVPQLESHFGKDELEKMYYYHALPEGWYNMEYFEFLNERRKRIAAIIRKGFEHLSE